MRLPSLLPAAIVIAFSCSHSGGVELPDEAEQVVSVSLDQRFTIRHGLAVVVDGEALLLRLVGGVRVAAGTGPEVSVEIRRGDEGVVAILRAGAEPAREYGYEVTLIELDQVEHAATLVVGRLPAAPSADVEWGRPAGTD